MATYDQWLKTESGLDYPRAVAPVKVVVEGIRIRTQVPGYTAADGRRLVTIGVRKPTAAYPEKQLYDELIAARRAASPTGEDTTAAGALPEEQLIVIGDIALDGARGHQEVDMSRIFLPGTLTLGGIEATV